MFSHRKFTLGLYDYHQHLKDPGRSGMDSHQADEFRKHLERCKRCAGEAAKLGMFLDTLPGARPSSGLTGEYWARYVLDTDERTRQATRAIKKFPDLGEIANRLVFRIEDLRRTATIATVSLATLAVILVTYNRYANSVFKIT